MFFLGKSSGYFDLNIRLAKSVVKSSEIAFGDWGASALSEEQICYVTCWSCCGFEVLPNQDYYTLF